MQLSAVDWLVKVDRLLTMPPIFLSHSILLIRILLKEIVKVSHRDSVLDGDNKCKRCHKTSSLHQNSHYLISSSSLVSGRLSHRSL